MENEYRDELGSVKISNEVIASIAGLAAMEIDGVVAMSGKLTDEIAERFGRKSADKGVRVEVTNKEVAIELALIVQYGVYIPELAWQVQENVRRAVENMTGLDIVKIDINIQGVSLSTERKENWAKPQK